MRQKKIIYTAMLKMVVGPARVQYHLYWKASINLYSEMVLLSRVHMMACCICISDTKRQNVLLVLTDLVSSCLCHWLEKTYLMWKLPLEQKRYNLTLIKLQTPYKSCSIIQVIFNSWRSVYCCFIIYKQQYNHNEL